MMNSIKTHGIYIVVAACFLACSCSKTSTGDNSGGGTMPPVITPPTTLTSDVSYWMTTGNGASLLARQTAVLGFQSATNIYHSIVVDSTQQYQSIDGFGFTLTQGSAYVINQLSATAKSALLTELFSTGDDGIGISYLRVGIGATDLSSTVFTYDDMPVGQTDPGLANFSLSADLNDVVPILKAALAVNPNIKIMAAPWTPPSWMKDNGNSKGGSLLPQYYDVYAAYFVKYIQAMQAQGIKIDAVTPQNEPLNPDNNPSLLMTAAQQATFIKASLGPAFAAAGITTKIVAYDHNLDRTEYPLTVLGDPAAAAFTDGAAFHLYAGDISAMSTVHNQFPAKNLYFTEQYTASNGDFSGDLSWHLKNVIIGSMRNWSKTALEWNLASDAIYGPHTVGGCTVCKGALTISSGLTTRNVGYYIVAHASKFVPPGSIRISSSTFDNVTTAAFLRPDGKKAMIILNEDAGSQVFNIQYKGRIAVTSLPAGAVATYMW